MRKWLYAPPAIVLGLFLLIAGVSLAPKPVFADCNCSITASAIVATESLCNYVKGRGLQCTYSGGTCNCSGAVPIITSSDQCNEDGVKSAYGGPGISFSANCTWSETSGNPNTGLSQQQIDAANGATVGTNTPPAPTTATPNAATSTSGCNPSDYKAPGGLLADVTNTACTACGQCTIADIFIVGNTVTKLILGLSGSIMLLMMIYAGFLFLTSSGNSGQIDTAKKIIFGAVIGLVIVFAAYTAVQFILGALGVPNVPEVFSRPFLTAAKK